MMLEYSEIVVSSYKNANDEFVFEYHHNDVFKMTRGENVWRNFYQDHHFLGSCDQKSNCFFKLSDDEVSINGEIQKLIKIADVPVGLIYQGHFYPVIIDHKKALIGLISEDGLQIKFLRQTTAWGEDKGTIGDKKFETQIAFGYSHLLKNPLIEKVIPGKLYFSGTRVYLSSKGEWLTADNTILWNPEKLVNLPGNWNPYRYANNDPVNFVDPSGLYGVPAVIFFGGVAMGAGSVLGQRMLDGNFNNASSAFASGFVAGVSAMFFGGVGGAIVLAGGDIGLTSLIEINPVTSVVGGFVGLAFDSLINFSSAFGSELLPAQGFLKMENSHSLLLRDSLKTDYNLSGFKCDKKSF